MIRNIVFDVNGVLLNKGLVYGALTLKLLPWENRTVQKTFSTSVWTDYNRGKYSNHEEAFKALGLGTDSHEYKCMRKYNDLKWQDHSEMEEYLKELRKDYKVYLLTNQSTYEWELIKDIPIIKNVDGVIVSCKEGLFKPEKEMFDLLTVRYGALPEETIFVDDRKVNVEKAEEFGFKGVTFRNPQQCRKEISETVNK